MGRIIDADLLLENALKYNIGRKSFDEIIKCIKEQPTVNHWIPCSERLPEENVPVLTCDKNGWISVNVNIPYFGNLKNDFECGYYLAWMPLPEPYKPEV